MFRKLRRILKWLVIAFFALSVLGVVAYRWLPVPLTPLMVLRCMQQAKDGRSLTLHHTWVPLDSMSAMPVAVIASEDQNFLSHNGFDVNAIKAAAEENLAGKRQRGGSTITQQTAKNVFLWPGRNWVRKGFEAYFTVLIELFWSKDRILEVYLNSIEMGDGIYGVEAVAQTNFGCHAKNLTKADCALVAATLPNPLRFSSRHPSPYMRKRQKWIQRQMRNISYPAAAR